MLADGAPVGMPWTWTLAFGQHEDRAPTHGYAATREAAMAACAKSSGTLAGGMWEVRPRATSTLRRASARCKQMPL